MSNILENILEIGEDLFDIQSCYMIDDCVRFNIGYKLKNVWIYESGTYYSFDDFMRFDNIERKKEDRLQIQNKIIDCKKELLIKIFLLIKRGSQ